MRKSGLCAQELKSVYYSYLPVVPKTIYPLRHGDSFMLPFLLSSLSIEMRKQFQRDHNIPYKV